MSAGDAEQVPGHPLCGSGFRLAAERRPLDPLVWDRTVDP